MLYANKSSKEWCNVIVADVVFCLHRRLRSMRVSLCRISFQLLRSGTHSKYVFICGQCFHTLWFPNDSTLDFIILYISISAKKKI